MDEYIQDSKNRLSKFILVQIKFIEKSATFYKTDNTKLQMFKIKSLKMPSVNLSQYSWTGKLLGDSFTLMILSIYVEIRIYVCIKL